MLGQMRPNNRTTLINDDLVGTTHRVKDWPLVEEAFLDRSRVVGELAIDKVEDMVPVWCVPVRFLGGVIAVLVRLQGPLRGRRRSTSSSISRSRFGSVTWCPTRAFLPRGFGRGTGIPRVGDGVILMDELGRIEFATRTR